MNKAKAGFSLIEALVALSIAAISLVAIFEMQQQLANGQRRAEAALARIALRQNALAVVRDLNPQLHPSGEVAMPPNLSYRWTSEPITAAKTSAGFPFGDGVFTVRLYRVTVTAVDSSKGPVGEVTVQRMGWSRQGGPAQSIGG